MVEIMVSREKMLSAFAPRSAPYRHMVGFEYEIFCFHRQDLTPLQFEGESGLKAVLEEAARVTGGEVLQPPGDLPSKVKLPDKSLLSLEPGGQLEFSSAPQETFEGVVKQLNKYLKILESLKNSFDLHFFYGGLNPVHTVDQIGLVTANPRYQIMNAYYPRTGTMGRRMMRQTCSVQISFDYKDAREGHDLLRTAQYVAPLAAAMLSNSPYVDGQPSGYRSFRVPIWANTDPARSGLLPGFTRPDYGFEDYLSHVLAAPMFFVRTPQGLEQARGMTFEEFNQQGFNGQQATFDDFDQHNSTIFTDVRLKNTVEVRTVDCQDPEMLPPVLALFCGILHCERSRLRSRLLLGEFTEEQYRCFPDRLARQGISGDLCGVPVTHLLGRLIDLAEMGLPACFPDGKKAARHLDPLRDLVQQGKTPADVVLERFGDRPVEWLRAGRSFQP